MSIDPPHTSPQSDDGPRADASAAPGSDGFAAPINLDNNATTQPSPGVVNAVANALTHTWHNPSSVHRAGQEARRVVELARASLAPLISVAPRTITLHASGTESIDQAIRGVVLARAGVPRAHAAPPIVVSTKVEHAAVRELIEHVESRGSVRARWLAVDRDGRVDLADAARLITPEVALVSVQWANNETGVLQPLAEVSKLVRAAQSLAHNSASAEPGPLLHTDATQWIGKLPARVVHHPDADPAAIDCDLLSFSPHKFHGPKGVGVLYRRPGLRLVPTLIGTQELGRRGGTENVAAIAGAGVAAHEALAWLADPAPRERLANMRDAFEREVVGRCAALGVLARINSAHAPRLWNTTNIAFARLEAEALLLALSERGLWASAGAACSSGSLDPSPVLLAMGLPAELAHGSLRFSLARHTTPDELDQAARVIAEAVARVSRSMPTQGPA